MKNIIILLLLFSGALQAQADDTVMIYGRAGQDLTDWNNHGQYFVNPADRVQVPNRPTLNLIAATIHISTDPGVLRLRRSDVMFVNANQCLNATAPSQVRYTVVGEVGDMYDSRGATAFLYAFYSETDNLYSDSPQLPSYYRGVWSYMCQF